MHPLDTIKVLQQASTSSISMLAAAKKILEQVNNNFVLINSANI